MTHVRKLFFLPAVIAVLGLMPVGRVAAQAFTTIHSFTNRPDGAGPDGTLILSGNTLYGTTYSGGTNFGGMVYAVNVNGTGYTNLYSFTGGSDGSNPRGGLVLAGNTLYGTTENGGTNGNGAIFSMTTNGTGFAKLHSFTAFTSSYPSINSDGANPYATMTLSGNRLYGTAYLASSNGLGTVFAINTDGSNFTNVYNFTGGQGSVPDDGAGPLGGLVLSGNTLYGTTENGGTGSGVVFSVKTNGTAIDPIYSLGYPYGTLPASGLVLSGGTLYGTTSEGGANDSGSIFAVNTNSSGFTNLYSFSAINVNTGTNVDGSSPVAALILSGGTLYGTAKYNGYYLRGTIFAISTNGTGFTNLYNFTGGNDGGYPVSGLVLSGTTLYGTTSSGGSSGDGTVFSLSLLAGAPTLNLKLSGTNVILTWTAAGYALEAATNLNTPVWTTISGQNAVTNPIPGTQRFYRLSQ